MSDRFSSIADRQFTHSFDIEKLKVQQNALARQGQLHWIHWLIVGLTLLITVFAWRISENALARENQIQFEQEAERVIYLMSERISHYGDALLSAVATMQVQDGEMSRNRWKRYADYLNLTERYPGANGIGVIHYVDTQNISDFVNNMRREYPDFSIHPEHPYELAMPIIYIEPEQTNAAAIGLDVAFETNRRTAALYARATGMSQISGPIVLVQDEGKTPGFLFYAPYYDHMRQPVTDWTDDRREARFRGLIYAPVVVKNLVEGVLSAQNRSVHLSIRDGNTILYSEVDQHADDQYIMTEQVEMHGRTWTFDLSSQLAPEGAGGIDQPMIVLLSGISLDAMLLGLFWLMSWANHRTLSMAKSMTDTLASQAQQLSDKNKDLENFAHVVSHDLKSPIRNIQSLVGIIDEDYADFLASNDEGLEIRETLDLMNDQAMRGQNLINGILDYSKLGADLEHRTTVDTRMLVETIARQLELSQNQLTLSGSFPVLYTHATLLEQVLSNLMGNAIKFNPNAQPATIAISATLMQGSQYCFSVTDNGPGIEARFHERIFQQFASVNTDQNIISSGIGLSIVKRSLEMQGATITVDSAPGKGSTFTFTWPISNSDVLPEAKTHSA